LDLKPDESANNVLLVTPSGIGKKMLLYHILQKSNPKWFPELPDKFFESQILLEPDEKFNRKVWVFDDLITVFRGTSTKQREQLMGFFNSFLTKGEYSRKGLKKTVGESYASPAWLRSIIRDMTNNVSPNLYGTLYACEVQLQRKG
jgi:hypothetical protein